MQIDKTVYHGIIISNTSNSFFIIAINKFPPQINPTNLKTIMPEQLFTKSPPQHRQSRKVYDYLIQQPQSNEKFTNGPTIPQHSPYSKEATEYELIVQFQLRRQKEKTIILEERLKNKESFIKQMKEFQDELTIAFEKCQQELHYYKAQCQDYQNQVNSFATFNNGIISNNNTNGSIIPNQPLPQPNHQLLIRQYVQEIAELKHLVIRLQQEINYHQKKDKVNTHNKYMSSSANNQLFHLKQTNAQPNQSINQKQISPIKYKQHKSKHTQKDKKQRSKTLANQFVEEKRYENFNTYTQIAEFIQLQTRKISSFINHFLTMCQFFEQSIERQPSVKHKLKKAWKWIKSSIVEWNYLKTQKIQKVKEYKIGNIVTKLLPISNLEISQIQNLLQKILKSKYSNTQQ